MEEFLQVEILEKIKNGTIIEINDFPGYFIGSDGKVWSNVGKGSRRDLNIIKNVDFYQIKPRETKNGYLRVYVRRKSDNKRVDLYIHRLVATYFIPNPENKRYVNHKDCNRHNNDFKNLEWVTVKENTSQTLSLKHMIRNNEGKFVGNFDYRTMFEKNK